MNSKRIYPRTGDKETVYLKSVITKPDIIVGEYTMYNDFCITISYMIRPNLKTTMFCCINWRRSHNRHQSRCYERCSAIYNCWRNTGKRNKKTFFRRNNRKVVTNSIVELGRVQNKE